jgi:hypothetical protein
MKCAFIVYRFDPAVDKEPRYPGLFEQDTVGTGPHPELSLFLCPWDLRFGRLDDQWQD